MEAWAKRLLEKTRTETPYKLLSPLILPLLLLHALALLAWELTLLALDAAGGKLRSLRRCPRERSVWEMTNAEFIERACDRYGINRSLKPEQILELAQRCNLVALWRVDQGLKVVDGELLAEIDSLPEEFVRREDGLRDARKRAFLLGREQELGQDGEGLSTVELEQRSQERTLLRYHALVLEQVRALGHPDPTFRSGPALIAYLEEHAPGLSERLLREALRPEEMDEGTARDLIAEQRRLERELGELEAQDGADGD